VKRTPIRADRRTLLVGGGAAVLAALLAGCKETSANAGAQPTTGATTPSSASSPSSTDPSSASPDTSASATAAPVTSLLKVGSSGAEVSQLQQRLADLGYWNGPNDGKFGTLTEQAVWALQKSAGLPRSGSTTPETLAALDARKLPTPKSTKGHVIEIDLSRDVLMFVTDGKVEHVLNTSTGGGYTYTSEGHTEKAITPKGHFSTYRYVDGIRNAPLGLLYRPRYFTGGYAIHGAASVPKTPASHGCCRVTNAAMDWIWAQNLDPVGTPVWIY
jgi:peptidoglycan hydrolase-like protein with peptidoglycan-binding domain